jgi:hypothetical protein
MLRLEKITEASPSDVTDPILLSPWECRNAKSYRLNSASAFWRDKIMAAGDEWTVLRYEWNMARLLFAYLLPQKYDALELTLQNAVVECLVLHTRILAEILLSDGKGADDIRLERLLPGFQSKNIERLKSAYGAGKGSPRWQFNKLLAHATLHRSDSHDYVHATNAVWPHILKIMDEVKLARPPIGLE